MTTPNTSQARPGTRSSAPATKDQLQPARQPSEVPPTVSTSVPADRKWESLPGWTPDVLPDEETLGQLGKPLVDFLIEALSAYRSLLVGIRTRQELELEHPQGFNPVPASVTVTKLQLSDQGVTHCEQLLESLTPFRTPLRVEPESEPTIDPAS